MPMFGSLMLPNANMIFFIEPETVEKDIKLNVAGSISISNLKNDKHLFFLSDQYLVSSSPCYFIKLVYQPPASFEYIIFLGHTLYVNRSNITINLNEKM